MAGAVHVHRPGGPPIPSRRPHGGPPIAVRLGAASEGPQEEEEAEEEEEEAVATQQQGQEEEELGVAPGGEERVLGGLGHVGLARQLPQRQESLKKGGF